MKENESREICTIFEKFNRSSFPITTETKISDLEINSILFIHAIIEVEKKFDVLFEDEFLDMSYFKTVENIIDFIDKNRSVIGGKSE